MSGAPCPPALLKSIREQIPTVEHILVNPFFMFTLYIIDIPCVCLFVCVFPKIPYGSTECSPVVSMTSIRDTLEKQLGTVGKPLDHLEIKIIDPKTRELQPINTPGEVAIRGHCTYVGYWNDEKQTEEVYSKTRWYHTG